jgi:hypothetical protein
MLAFAETFAKEMAHSWPQASCVIGPGGQSEGFDRADLKDAKALLDQLNQ